MSEEPEPYETRSHSEAQPASLAFLARSLATADYGDLVEGYGMLTWEAEVRLARQIGRLVQQALALEGRG
jgi:hypothetical protein